MVTRVARKLSIINNWNVYLYLEMCLHRKGMYQHAKGMRL